MVFGLDFAGVLKCSPRWPWFVWVFLSNQVDNDFTWGSVPQRKRFLPGWTENPTRSLKSGFGHPRYRQMHLTAVVFAECPADCESCVNSETCTRCRQGLYLLSGRCHHVCPDDFEPSDKLMECTPQGQSERKVVQKPQNRV